MLSTLPIMPRITPLVARKLISENIEPNSKISSPTSWEYKAVIKRLSELGLARGIIYDALIAKVAQKCKVERLLTLNIDHFIRAWPGGEKIITFP